MRSQPLIYTVQVQCNLHIRSSYRAKLLLYSSSKRLKGLFKVLRCHGFSSSFLLYAQATEMEAMESNDLRGSRTSCSQDSGIVDLTPGSLQSASTSGSSAPASASSRAAVGLPASSTALFAAGGAPVAGAALPLGAPPHNLVACLHPTNSGAPTFFFTSDSRLQVMQFLLPMKF